MPIPGRWLDSLTQDIRHGWRMIWSTPGLSIAAIFTLALGIGTTTALFSVVDAVVLKPLPYRDVDRLVVIALVPSPNPLRTMLLGEELTQSATHLSYATSSSDLRKVEGLTEVFEGVYPVVLTALDLYGTIGRLRDEGGTTIIHGGLAPPEFFRGLGLRPVLGRTFSATDEEDVVLISFELWKRHFASDPLIVGRPLRLASGIKTVVGVLPVDAHLTYPVETQFWLPLPRRFIQTSGRAAPFHIFARLRDGVSLERANAAVDAAGIGRAPGREVLRAQTQSMSEWVSGRVRPALTLVSGTALLLLIIAYSNVALLLITRAMRKARETAVRAAIGASRSRLLREALVETGVVGAIGVAAGVALARILHPLIRWMVPSKVPRIEEMTLDVRSLAFAALAGIACVIVTGLAVHRAMGMAPLLQALTRFGYGSTLDRRGGAWRRALIGAQAALIVALVASTGLLVQSFWRLSHVDLGFAPEHVVSARISVRTPIGQEPDEHWRRFREEVERLVAEIPGVTESALISTLPFEMSGAVTVPAGRQAPTGVSVYARQQFVTPRFFSVADVNLLAGRLFSDNDMSPSSRTLILSLGLARSLFGEQSPVGRTLDFRDTYEVVGVVEDVRWSHPTLPSEPTFYIPLGQSGARKSVSILARTNSGLSEFAASARAAVRVVDPDQALESVASLTGLVDDATADWRFYGSATSSFSVLALAIGGIGIFGAVAASITERRREIGIRTALGARRGELLALSMRHAVLPVLVGLCVGAVGAFWAVKLLRRFLFEVSPGDPLIFGVASMLVIVVALSASWFSARRATDVNPNEVLREA